MVIDIVIKCNRTLAARTLLTHSGDLVARAVVAGVVGWTSLLVTRHMVNTTHVKSMFTLLHLLALVFFLGKVLACGHNPVCYILQVFMDGI